MSAKLRLTAWFTLMMLLLCAATLTFVFVVNGAAVADDPQSQLIARVDKNARDVEFENGRFEWEDLKFYRRGVSCWVCDESGAFLEGVQRGTAGAAAPGWRAAHRFRRRRTILYV
mgnify:CR=1 FL=1